MNEISTATCTTPVTTTYDFQKLCGPLRSSLMSTAMRLSMDRAQAEDYVQTTYLYAWESWDSFESEGKDPKVRASAWMHRILKNVFRDAWRRADSRNNVFEHSRAEILASTMANTYGDVAVHHDTDGRRLGTCDVISNVGIEMPVGIGGFLDFTDDAVAAAVNALPDIWRDVILRTARGEDDNVIGVEIGQDPRNVRKRVHRARRRLVEVLAPSHKAAA